MTDTATPSPDQTFDLQSALTQWRARADRDIAARLSVTDGPTANLLNAMHYAVSAGGKRIRPALVYATGDALGAAPATLEAPAAAIEMIHAYSLVHDDLPAMDDDDLRRGQPTVHIKFDEATAILAGDALQTQAFLVLASDTSNPAAARADMLACLAHYAGADGMAGGQAIDLAAVSQQLTLDQLQHMHQLKTGGLIRAAVQLGAIAAGANPTERSVLSEYSDALGLAFQIADDILDVTADTQTLGKRQGADAAQGKPTYCSILGIERAREEAEHARRRAHDALNTLTTPIPALAALVDYAVSRAY